MLKDVTDVAASLQGEPTTPRKPQSIGILFLERKPQTDLHDTG